MTGSSAAVTAPGRARAGLRHRARGRTAVRCLRRARTGRLVARPRRARSVPGRGGRRRLGPPRARDPAGRAGLPRGPALRAGRTVAGVARATARAPRARAGGRGARAVRPPRRRRGARTGTQRGTGVRVGCRHARRCQSGSVVLANELLDNLGVRDRRVGRHALAGSAHHHERFRVRRGARPRHRHRCAALHRVAGARVSRSVPASRCRAASSPGSSSVPARCRAGSSRCSTTSSMSMRSCARGRDWLRTYRGHERGVGRVGRTRQPGHHGRCRSRATRHTAPCAGFRVLDDTTQAEWLAGTGIDELVAAGRRAWDAGAARGDLAAIAGRSRANEAAALTDPGGLGAHRVVTLAKSAGPSRSEGR